MALYLQNTVQKRDPASCFRLKELIRRHVEQNIISGSTDSFNARNEEEFLQGLRCKKASYRPEFTLKNTFKKHEHKQNDENATVLTKNYKSCLRRLGKLF